ncbi:MAG: type II toxin-antitoxin system VapC family toxin [Gammaproteobacteria bacterium]|nr:type II toxin-antitoxin system VapC family toxin [Gammaproteobacteria bacterium]MDX2460253.1 type II toxin-antitoxin system VapC family toxin [Gammaproteobacteria bacterium]
MRLLLDTPCWLWMQASPENFSSRAREMVDDPGTVLLLSPVSAWEISTKYALGRLTLPVPPAEYVPGRMKSSGVDALPLQHSHALQVASLPWHHQDPFDRLLIAQAQVEALTILSADRQLAAYDVALQWAD